MSPLETTQTAPLTLWDDGSIRIGSSRVTLDSLVHEFARGATAEQIQADLPSLSLREIYGAISYYLEHEDQVADYLRGARKKPIGYGMRRKTTRESKRCVGGFANDTLS